MFHLYLRMIARFWKLCIARETQYRANFITIAFVGLMETVITILPMMLVFSYADDVVGWGAGEALALVGLFRIAISLYALVMGEGVFKLSEDVQKGSLDLILIRPVHAQFYVTFRHVSLGQIANVFTGVAVFIIGLSQASMSWTPKGALQAAILFSCGMILLGAAISAGSYIAFRATTIEGLPMVLQDVAEMGRYPISFYPGAVRVFLTGVMPVAFVTTFPIDALRGSVGWEMCAIAVAFATFALMGLRWWWNNSVRHYASASS